MRLLAPAGELRIAGDCVVADSGRPDPVDLAAQEHAVANLPHDALVYLLGSRYCETDLMMDKAWELFGRLGFFGGEDAWPTLDHRHLRTEPGNALGQLDADR